MPSTSPRIVFVTGKGGVGKSYVARLLAHSQAEAGRRVALLNCDGRPAAASAQGQTSKAAYGGVDIVDFDEGRALAALVGRVIPLAFVARRLLSSRTFAAVAAAAPGIADLALLWTIAGLADGRTGVYDLVVVDGPASGQALKVVGAPRATTGLGLFGRMDSLARDLEEMLGDAQRFRALVVTTAEELAVLETQVLVDGLAERGVDVAAVVANAVWPRHCNREQEDWLTKNPSSYDSVHYLSVRREQLRALAALTGPRPPFVVAYRFDSGTDDTDAARALAAHLAEAWT
ncbi:MAG: ArsA-related P-loop ATPase [Deltaproteobacteria bacterium]|jgi:anion-transporting  ArsA/GET3 family ATPase